MKTSLKFVRHINKTAWRVCARLCVALVPFLSSCGLDFEVDDAHAVTATAMSLGYDTVYVMRGDTLTLRPVFKPDSVNNRDVYISSSNPSVVSVNPITGHLEAIGKGWAKLFAESVSSRLLDSCAVCVMNPWVPDNSYPHETVFYATVTLAGKPLPEGMIVAAFVNDECRCLGVQQSFHGVAFTLFRVGSETWPYEQNPDIPGIDIPVDEEEEGEGDDGGYLEEDRETIEFRCYDFAHYKLYTSPLRINFDGETYGTLSNLYKIEF